MFRMTGQVLGVSLSGAIVQAILQHDLVQLIRGKHAKAVSFAPVADHFWASALTGCQDHLYYQAFHIGHSGLASLRPSGRGTGVSARVARCLCGQSGFCCCDCLGTVGDT